LSAPPRPTTVLAATAEAISEAAHVSAITQLVLIERESRDLGRWERMKACFHPDSVVRISWFSGNGHDFVDASRDMARRGTLAKHRLGPVSVRISGHRAVASLACTIDIPAMLQGVAVLLSSHARVFYRAELRNGGWGLSSFEVFYMRDELAPQVPGEVVPVKAAEIAGYRQSYRFLAHVLASNGFPVRDDLAGEDKPETVVALCRDIHDWAGLEH
jgi:SnoaL-like domain